MTTWTVATDPDSEYIEVDNFSLWDAVNWDEFNWADGSTSPSDWNTTTVTTVWS